MQIDHLIVGRHSQTREVGYWAAISFALAALCVLTLPSVIIADCWVGQYGPWGCNEGEIGCFHPNWMDSLDGSLLISEISIPGTHETMASENGDWYILCQTVQDLSLQLDAGVRALDIRCRHAHDRFAIHHNYYYQEAWFGEPLDVGGHAGDKNVMKECVQFLYDNPSEFILMRIQQTHSEEATTRSFSETLEWYLNEDGCNIMTTAGDSAYVFYRDFVWTSNSYLDGYPTVDEVRRKIVILQDCVTKYRVGNGPRRIIAADFDQNGYSDLANVNIADDNVAILLNKGDMTFKKQHFSTPGGPRDVCAADFNQDGWLDLAVVAFNGGHHMAILLNRADGSGTFHDYIGYDVASEPIGIAVIDHNLDELPDLLVACAAGACISVMTNVSYLPGSFTRSDLYCGHGPKDVVSADFNFDGYPDIALVKFRNPGGNYMAVFIHNGVDSWGAYSDYSVVDDPVAITVFDHNRDSLPDLVVAGQSDNRIRVMTNSSSSPGSFTGTNLASGDNPKDLVSSDFNNDGYPDIALVKYQNIAGAGNYMAVFLHDGGASWHTYKDYVTPNDPHGICVADLNRDGNDELIVTGLSERHVQIFEGDGMGSFYGAHYGPPWSIFDIQDEYEMWETAESFNNKEIKIKRQIDSARVGDPGTLYINFVSGSTHVNPIRVALGSPYGYSGMNLRTYNYLSSFLPHNPGRCGVIMMDFPGPGLIEAIIKQNDLIPTSVDGDDNQVLSLSFEVNQNYPNPFNPVTTVAYSLPERTHVMIAVYNVLGQKVCTLVDRDESAGTYAITWDGRSESGQTVSTGVYLYRFEAGEHVQTKKMVLLK